MKAEEDTVFEALLAGYRAGIPAHWSSRERKAAEDLFAVMAEVGGKRLVGDSLSFTPGTFWADWEF
jgi:NitT/TauT family transport system substrate-binding protein